VDGRVGALALDDPENRSGSDVDHGERVRSRGAEREASRRVVSPAPDESRLRPLQLALLSQGFGALERLGAQVGDVALVERGLEGGGADMAVQHARVGMVEDGGLDVTSEQRFGLAHEELVEGVLARDEHGEPLCAPARPPPLLAEARDRPREPDRDGAVE
jgi:hypothetical protein